MSLAEFAGMAETAADAGQAIQATAGSEATPELSGLSSWRGQISEVRAMLDELDAVMTHPVLGRLGVQLPGQQQNENPAAFGPPTQAGQGVATPTEPPASALTAPDETKPETPSEDANVTAKKQLIKTYIASQEPDDVKAQIVQLAQVIQALPAEQLQARVIELIDHANMEQIDMILERAEAAGVQLDDAADQDGETDE